MENQTVETVYAGYKGSVGKALRSLRSLVLDVAEKTEGVGEIEEALRWGQPSFITVRPKSGSPIRIDAVKDNDTKYAMYFICTTSLVEQFREHYPEEFDYVGNRTIIFDVNSPIAEAELRHCVSMALTYKLKK